MNRFAAALSLAAFASPAIAQDMIVRFEPTGDPNTYEMVAEFVGPGEDCRGYAFETRAVTHWSSVGVRFSGDAEISIVSWNNCFNQGPFGGAPTISGNGTGDVLYVGRQSALFGGADISNPLFVLTFEYAGSPDAFLAEMEGVNNALIHVGPFACGMYFQYSDGMPGEYELAFRPLIDVVCPADVNGDFAVTPGDFNAWVIAFNSQSAGCDQNNDGMCTPGDFNAWVINYNAGC